MLPSSSEKGRNKADEQHHRIASVKGHRTPSRATSPVKSTPSFGNLAQQPPQQPAAPQQSGFSFGQSFGQSSSSQLNPAPQNGFSFGQGQPQPAQSNGGFSFGQSQAAAPSGFTFGQSQPSTQSNPFSFGATPSSFPPANTQSSSNGFRNPFTAPDGQGNGPHPDLGKTGFQGSVFNIPDTPTKEHDSKRRNSRPAGDAPALFATPTPEPSNGAQNGGFGSLFTGGQAAQSPMSPAVSDQERQEIKERERYMNPEQALGLEKICASEMQSGVSTPEINVTHGELTTTSQSLANSSFQLETLPTTMQRRMLEYVRSLPPRSPSAQPIIQSMFGEKSRRKTQHPLLSQNQKQEIERTAQLMDAEDQKKLARVISDHCIQLEVGSFGSFRKRKPANNRSPCASTKCLLWIGFPPMYSTTCTSSSKSGRQSRNKIQKDPTASPTHKRRTWSLLPRLKRTTLSRYILYNLPCLLLQATWRSQAMFLSLLFHHCRKIPQQLHPST